MIEKREPMEFRRESGHNDVIPGQIRFNRNVVFDEDSIILGTRGEKRRNFGGKHQADV